MPLSSATVKRLGSSRFNYWFGYVANGGWVAWLVSRAWAPANPVHSAATLAGWLGFGLLLWSLCEYALHRWLYHVIPSPLQHGHALHHLGPKELIGVPWWFTSAALALLYAALAQGCDASLLGVTMAGVWLGYIAYCLLHHGSHHWAMRGRYLRYVKRHHQLHHAHDGCNWGFTSPIWDIVFGTHRAANRRNSPAERRVNAPTA